MYGICLLQTYTYSKRNHVMDKIIESMTLRFVNNSPFYMDLSLLSPAHFDSIKKSFPENALKTIYNNLFRFTDCENVEEYHKKSNGELINFTNNQENLKKSIDYEYINIDNFYATENVQEGRSTNTLQIQIVNHAKTVCLLLFGIINEI